MASTFAEKTNSLFIQGKCLNDCEVILAVGQERRQFYVCKDQLGKLSDYFRVMFFGDFKEKNEKQFEITDENPEDMICFFNAIDPDPDVRKIAGDSVELLMHLADKFQCDLLKKLLKYHIQVNWPDCESPSTIFNWLVLSLKYNMPEDMIKVCLDIQDIGVDSIELLMRSADEYQCDALKERLKQCIEVNGSSCDSASTVLNWLIWSEQYNMPEDIVKACLNVQKIDDDSIEFLMDSADKYHCDVLKERLKEYIEVNEPTCQSASTILNWLVWSLQYHMPEEVIKMCLPGVACLSLSILRANRERLGCELYGKVLDVKMQLKCKTTELYKAKITLASSFKCSSCSLIDHLSYRIQWCKATIHTYFRCPSCLEVGYSHCCEKCDFYYKCPDCTLDPLSYTNKEQCLCKRKNYEIMLKEIP